MAVHHITSATNSDFKGLKRLAQSSRERRDRGRTLLEGGKLIGGFLKAGGRPQQIVCSDEAWAKGSCEPFLEGDASVTVLRDGLFKSISDVKTPSGIMALIAVPPEKPPAGDGPAVVLDGIQDPGNLGTILRSAAAADFKQVFLSSHGADPWSPKVLRSGMGAHFFINLNRGGDLVAAATGRKGILLALDHRADQSIYDLDLGGDVVLLVGSEGRGLSRELLDAAELRARIPMPGWDEPLNAAMAATVCLFEALRQRRAG